MIKNQIKQRLDDYCEQHMLFAFMLLGIVMPILSVVALFIIVTVVVYSGMGIVNCFSWMK